MSADPMTPPLDPSVTREEAASKLVQVFRDAGIAEHHDGSEWSEEAALFAAKMLLAALDANPAARAAIGAYLVPDRLAGLRVREGDPNAVYPAFDVTGAYRAAPDRLAALERVAEAAREAMKHRHNAEDTCTPNSGCGIAALRTALEGVKP